MRDKIILSMSDEKLSALEMYLAQRNTTLIAEIDKYAEQLYSKTVPQNVRGQQADTETATDKESRGQAAFGTVTKVLQDKAAWSPQSQRTAKPTAY